MYIFKEIYEYNFIHQFDSLQQVSSVRGKSKDIIFSLIIKDS